MKGKECKVPELNVSHTGSHGVGLGGVRVGLHASLSTVGSTDGESHRPHGGRERAGARSGLPASSYLGSMRAGGGSRGRVLRATDVTPRPLPPPQEIEASCEGEGLAVYEVMASKLTHHGKLSEVDGLTEMVDELNKEIGEHKEETTDKVREGERGESEGREGGGVKG